jgi:hypothetical protein
MFLQVWDALKKQRIVSERDVIEERQVLMNLDHVSQVGNHRQCPSRRHPEVKVNNVQRFAPVAIPMLWWSIARRVIAEVEATFAVKTEADSERHRAPHQSLRAAWFRFGAWVTSSLSLSEAGSSCTTTKEQKPFTGDGRSSSMR